MIKINFLGTCSGTEPMPDMKHCCIVFEIGGQYYWFDAGEGCSHTACAMGINVKRIRSVFISHMHIDHIGGLANLIHAINKITAKHKISHINNNSYDVFIPHMPSFESIKEIAVGCKFKPASDYPVKLVEHEVSDGVIFDDGIAKVTALHNTHLREDGSCGWHSYSYLIEAEGKRIVFSGDVGAPSELDGLIKDGCDLLIMETGHHKVSDVLDYAESRNIKRLRFNHHGREIIGDRAAAQKLLDERDIDAIICHDGMTETI